MSQTVLYNIIHPCKRDTYICLKGVWNRGVPPLLLIRYSIYSRNHFIMIAFEKPLKHSEQLMDLPQCEIVQCI